LKLRPYQEEAVGAVYQHLRERDDNPCVVIPTGGGKTPVIATMCRDAVDRWNGRVLILAHVKELLEQSVAHLNRLLDWDKVGVYSAGLRSRDTEHPVIVAGIQSVYRRACELGSFDLILIDEAHMIPESGDGMYRSFLEDARAVNPNVRLIGFTATPYRMKSGMICGTENLLNHVCYEVGVRELIVGGYLSPLVTKASKEKIDTSGLHVRVGEFVASEAEELMNTDDRVASACAEILERTADRKAALIFCAGIEHAVRVAAHLYKHAPTATVFGETEPRERDQAIEAFKAGRLKYLVNVNVLTMGFDAPHIDCVAMVRPTLSPGLYYQMAGRGFRLHPGKENCLVLDFGGNVLRHGPVDAIRIRARASESGGDEAPAKECPQCGSVVAAGYALCPDCGEEFPERRKIDHDAKASSASVLSAEVTTTRYPVRAVFYNVHTKRDAPESTPKTMRVEYQLGFNRYQSEWVCFEHAGYARSKAERWWRRRTDQPVPDTAAEAVTLAGSGVLHEPRAIVVRSVSGESYDRIVDYEWDENAVSCDQDPAPVVAGGLSIDAEDIPF
jgi:DNA repair protein RadD